MCVPLWFAQQAAVLWDVINVYLRNGAFFPVELNAGAPLAFRLPVLLEELKSASLPAGINSSASAWFSGLKHLRHCRASAFFQFLLDLLQNGCC